MAHITQLYALLDDNVREPSETRYGRSIEQVSRALHGALQGDVYTAASHRAVMSRLRSFMEDVLQSQLSLITSVSRDATDVVRAQFARDAKRFSIQVTERPLKVDVTELRRYMRRFLDTIESKVDAASKQAFAQGQSQAHAQRAILDVLQRHQGSVRTAATTSVSTSYNRAYRDAYLQVNPRDRERVRLRWTELVNDRTGKPMDNRVGVDSIVMHGQVATDGLFTMPHDPRVSSSLYGQWPYPPNRRNDRAVLALWDKSQNVPAYTLVHGKRTVL